MYILKYDILHVFKLLSYSILDTEKIVIIKM